MFNPNSLDKSPSSRLEKIEQFYSSKKSEQQLKKQIDEYKVVLNNKLNDTGFFYLSWLKKLPNRENLLRNDKLLFSLVADASVNQMGSIQPEAADKVTAIQLKAIASIILVKGTSNKEFTKNNDNKTTLYLAIEKKHFELAELLLAYDFSFL